MPHSTRGALSAPMHSCPGCRPCCRFCRGTTHMALRCLCCNTHGVGAVHGVLTNCTGRPRAPSGASLHVASLSRTCPVCRAAP